MREVEMRPAFEWTCDECGRDQFARSVVPEMSEEERIELRLDQGIDDEELGHFMMMPTHVVCQHCGAEFETTGFENEDSEEST